MTHVNNILCEICSYPSPSVKATDALIKESRKEYYVCDLCYSRDLVTKRELKEIREHVKKYPKRKDEYTKYIDSSEDYYSQKKAKFNLNCVTFTEVKFKKLSDHAKVSKPIEATTITPRVATYTPLEVKKSPIGTFCYNVKDNDLIEVKDESMKIHFIFNSPHTLEKCPKELSLEETFEYKDSCYFTLYVKESSEGELVELEFKNKSEVKKITVSFTNL